MSTKSTKQLSKYERFLAKNKRLAKSQDDEESPGDEYSEFVNILSDAKRLNNTLSTQNLFEYFALLIQSYCNDAISQMRFQRFTPKLNLRGYKHHKFSNDCDFYPILYPKLKNKENELIIADEARSRFITASLPRFNYDQSNVFDLQLLSSSDLQWRSYEDIESYNNQYKYIAAFVLPNDKIQMLGSNGTITEKTTTKKDTISSVKSYKVVFSDCERKETIQPHDGDIYCWQQSVDGEVYMIVKGKGLIKLYKVRYNIDTQRIEGDLMESFNYKYRDIYTFRGLYNNTVFGYYYAKKWNALFIATTSSLIMINFNYKDDIPLIAQYTLKHTTKFGSGSCLYYVKELNRLLIICGNQMYEFDGRNLFDCVELNGKKKEFDLKYQKSDNNSFEYYQFSFHDQNIDYFTIVNSNPNGIYRMTHKGIDWEYNAHHEMITDYNQKAVLCISENNQNFAKRFKYVVIKYPINHESINTKKPVDPNKSSQQQPIII
mmetsp:Transcript_56654/g.50979  ORF Transcript_56654/g.50979 Transcript_56654/m.50979 type:complete len:489 (-) Transcript_56654:95-1561(-)